MTARDYVWNNFRLYIDDDDLCHDDDYRDGCSSERLEMMESDDALEIDH